MKNNVIPKHVVWEGTYGVIGSHFIKDKNGKIVGHACGGQMGLEYYPMCPHCGEYAYNEKPEKGESLCYCVFCKKPYYPVDWDQRPPAVIDEESIINLAKENKK